MLHEVRVSPLPIWLDAERLLGPERFQLEPLEQGWLDARAVLPTSAAADLSARLRGLGIAGRPLSIEVEPMPGRRYLRRALRVEAQRRRQRSPGFTRRGVRFDAEGKISLTPEALARSIGQRAAGLRVVDACCGLAGNAIGFARAGCQVVAIDLDAQRLDLARHNARIYDVAEHIVFRSGDARELVPGLSADLLFIDPPWGLDYDRKRTSSTDLPLLAALIEQGARFPRIWAKLPASFDLGSLPRAPSRVEGVFGAAAGDFRRVKFLLVELE